MESRARVEPAILELTRGRVFNALISNTDDHPRSHAIVAPGLEWRLAPTYDLTPFPAIGIERRDVAPHGRQRRPIRDRQEPALRLRVLHVDPARRRRESSMTSRRERNRWYAMTRREGVSEAGCATIANAFV